VTKVTWRAAARRHGHVSGHDKAIGQIEVILAEDHVGDQPMS
jgi:hypothetical protein